MRKETTIIAYTKWTQEKRNKPFEGKVAREE